jgi:hypothetical protein
MSKIELYKKYIDNWKLGKYSEEVAISNQIKSDDEVQDFLSLVLELLHQKNDWSSYLSVFAAGASVFYKNPSLAFFYENPIIKDEIIQRMTSHDIPKVTEIDPELFDVFAANIEHNVDVQEILIEVLKDTISKTNSYNQLYNDYLTFYLRLYRHTLKLSDKDLDEYKSIIISKVDTWGEPSETELEAFHNIIETFEIESYTLKEEIKTITKKKFLFFKENHEEKIKHKHYFSFTELAQKLKNS